MLWILHLFTSPKASCVFLGRHESTSSAKGNSGLAVVSSSLTFLLFFVDIWVFLCITERLYYLEVPVVIINFRLFLPISDKN